MPTHHHGPRSGQFDPAHAHRLDDPERFRYLPPQTVVAFVDAPAHARVVDLGAGTGTYAIAFARERPDCNVVAIDVQEEMLSLLRAKPEAAGLRAGGYELLDELAGTIDRVFAINVLHHLGSDDLQRVFSALAPQARLAFIDWNPEVERPVGGPPNSKLYGPGEAQRYLESVGFVVQRTLTLPYHFAFYGKVSQ